MSIAYCDHMSIVVADPDGAAKALRDLFGWEIKSVEPTTIKGGRSIVVGTEEASIALCASVAADPVPAEALTSVTGHTLTLNHIGIPARNPESLAAWYGGHFKLMVEGAFAYGDGWLIACELGVPLTEAPAHFGFMLDDSAEVDWWKTYFEGQGIAADTQRNGNAIFVTDPEGNSFEIFFDPTLFVAPS